MSDDTLLERLARMEAKKDIILSGHNSGPMLEKIKATAQDLWGKINLEGHVKIKVYKK